LLKNYSFKWPDSTKEAFQKLKVVVTSPPYLALPDFPKQFVIECDASEERTRVVLMQEKRPIAFISQAFKGRALHL
jgi:hypothetical protein